MGTSLSDKECIDRFKKGDEWGLLTSIDLRDCDPQKIRSREVITQFSIDLCDHIKMKRFGDPIVVRFGADPRVQAIPSLSSSRPPWSPGTSSKKPIVRSSTSSPARSTGPMILRSSARSTLGLRA